jgi:carbon storage regulator
MIRFFGQRWIPTGWYRNAVLRPRRNAMLVLSRRVGEEIVIHGNVRLSIVAVKGHGVRVGIAAPPSVTVDRKEIHDRRAELTAHALPASTRRSKGTVRH